MAKKLDKARDYAVIVGDTEGRTYEQDHLYFTAEGLQWVDPAAPAPKQRKAAAAPVASALDEQVASQLGQVAEPAAQE